MKDPLHSLPTLVAQALAELYAAGLRARGDEDLALVTSRPWMLQTVNEHPIIKFTRCPGPCVCRSPPRCALSETKYSSGLFVVGRSYFAMKASLVARPDMFFTCWMYVLTQLLTPRYDSWLKSARSLSFERDKW
jgi:hypothetical protein